METTSSAPTGEVGKKASAPAVSRWPSVAAITAVLSMPALTLTLKLLDGLCALVTKYQLHWIVVATVLGVAIAVALTVFALSRLVSRWSALRPWVKASWLVASLVPTAILVWVAVPRSTRHVLSSWVWGPTVQLATRNRVAQRQVVNLPWLNYGWDFGTVPAWNVHGVASHQDEVTTKLQRLKDDGANAVVWFLLADGRSEPVFDHLGAPLTLSPTFWADYDAGLEIARKVEIGVLWVLLDQGWFLPDRDETEDGRTIHLTGHARSIQEPGARKAFLENVLKPLVGRYAHERQILGWILVNEPDNVVNKNYISLEVLRDFTKEASELLHRETSRQPVSLAFNDLESLALAAPQGLAEPLDFLVFHHYSNSLPVPADHVRAAFGFGNKPIYVGEFDVCDAPSRRPRNGRRTGRTCSGTTAFGLGAQSHLCGTRIRRAAVMLLRR